MSRLLIVGLVLSIAGCSLADKQPAFHDFGRSGVSLTRQGNVSINVNAPTWLWDNRIRYRLLFASPSEVRFYGLDRWIASPSELFEQLLISSGKLPDYSLLIRLQDFEQQFDAPAKAHVVLRFSVEVFITGDKGKIAEKEFYLVRPTQSPDALGAINGFTALVNQATEEISIWLLGLASQPSPLPTELKFKK